LVDKKYEKALIELESAHDLNPNDDTVESDLGALYLEMALQAGAKNDAAGSMVSIEKSLEHLDHALELDPRLPAALFNRALCLQLALNTDQARQAWRAYLAVDPETQWAVEARYNLQQLESKAYSDRSAKDVEEEFLNAMKSGDESQARDLLVNNRELIREKYLPQRLAMSFVQDRDRRPELTEALHYAGRLEKGATGDEFAEGIAGFYTSASTTQLATIEKAHADIRAGYELCLSSHYEPARVLFEQGRQSFVSVNDEWEAALAGYFIGYTLANTGQVDRTLSELESVAAYARKHKYLWLDATATYWIAGAHLQRGEHTNASESFKRALSLAEGIKDSYAIQRNLLELAKLSSEAGQRDDCLAYISRILQESASHGSSLRQQYRNHSLVFEMLSQMEMPHLARAVAVECVTLADAADDKAWMSESRSQAGAAFTRTGAFQNAQQWIDEATQSVLAVDDADTRRRLQAFASLRRGDLRFATRDFDGSQQAYADAIEYYDASGLPSFRQQGHMGLLKSLVALDRADELQTQIPASIQIIEQGRKQILDERERSGFLDEHENVYDIATGFEFDRANYEKAFEYAESSSSRALLDWLEKGNSYNESTSRAEFLTSDTATPLSLGEIRARIPSNVQVVKYAELDDKLLIWVISGEQFATVSIAIPEAELEKKIDAYSKLITSNTAVSADERDKLGRELYSLVLAPIEKVLVADKRICLVPSKGLFRLPFAAIPLPDGTTVISRFTILYSPSLSVFLHCTKTAEEKGAQKGESLLAVGNPAFDRVKFADLAYLPNTEEEVKNISKQYDNARILLGANATKRQFLSSVKNADVVHFAGHYVMVPGAPTSSYLLLAKNGDMPGSDALTNNELGKYRLDNTKLIVLAACRSGIEGSSVGEGLVGLSRTFIAAGVPVVLGAAWDVESHATALLMKEFHSNRRNYHMATAEALQNAQLAVANDPSGMFKDPYYWAGFITIGGSTSF
jgi:CHAT domain-containing protein